MLFSISWPPLKLNSKEENCHYEYLRISQGFKFVYPSLLSVIQLPLHECVFNVVMCLYLMRRTGARLLTGRYRFNGPIVTAYFTQLMSYCTSATRVMEQAQRLNVLQLCGHRRREARL